MRFFKMSVFLNSYVLLGLTLGACVKAESRTNYSEDVSSYYTSAQLSQSFAPCLELFPRKDTSFKQVFSEKWRGTELCSNQFAVYYSKLTKTPLVVVEKLNSKILADAKGEERTDNFYPDPRLKREDSASLSDYKKSSHPEVEVDRGHN